MSNENYNYNIRFIRGESINRKVFWKDRNGVDMFPSVASVVMEIGSTVTPLTITNDYVTIHRNWNDIKGIYEEPYAVFAISAEGDRTCLLKGVFKPYDK